MSTAKFKAILAASTAFCALLVALPTYAADAAAPDDIVITARKREETLQAAPLSVSAFSAMDIKSAKIENLADIAKLTPGLNYTPLFGAQNQLPIIRGQAQTFGVLNVGVFLDGVYLSGKAGVDIELNDLERVEVVRGPQSALYGRNTFAGAINYVTKAPSATFEGSAELTLGDHGLRKSIVTVSGPINDIMRFRAGVYGREFDGFYTSAIDGGKVDFAKNYGGLFTLEIKPNDRMTGTFRISVSQEDSGQPASTIVRTNALPGRPSGSPVGTVRNLVYVGALPSIPTSGVYVNTKKVGAEVGDYGTRSQIIRGSGELNFAFDGFDLTSITAYSHRTGDYTFDGDNTICDQTGGCRDFGFPFVPAITLGRTNFATSSADESYRDTSQELRINSKGDGALQWLAGVFYYENKTNSLQRSLAPVTTATQLSFGYPRLVSTTKSLAEFAQVSYDFNPQSTLIGELRHEREEQTYLQRPTNPIATGTSATVFNLRQADDFFTYRATYQYKLDDQKMVYGLISRGYKAGGFNSGLNILASQRTYDAETSWNYEIGTKTSWMDRKLRLNATAFYVDWSDQQAACQNPVSLGGSSTQRTYNCNVAASKIYGLETDANLKITPSLSIAANYTYTHAEYEKFVDVSLDAALALAGQPAYNFNGRSLPYVPDHKLVISPRYRVPLGNMAFEARADMSYQSKTYVRADNLQSFDAKTTLDLRAALVADKWTVQAFVDNALDDDTPVAAVRFFDSTNFSIAAPLVTGANRRQAGVNLTYKF
jgi:iron complex outermembrane receptor protein